MSDVLFDAFENAWKGRITITFHGKKEQNFGKLQTYMHFVSELISFPSIFLLYTCVLFHSLVLMEFFSI